MMKLMGWVIAAAATFMAPNAMAATDTAAPEADTVAAEEAAPAEQAYEYMTPDAVLGVPDGRKGLTDQVTAVGQQAADFHDNWLLVLCVVISVFVLGLLAYAMIRFRRSANLTGRLGAQQRVLLADAVHCDCVCLIAQQQQLLRGRAVCEKAGPGRLRQRKEAAPREEALAAAAVLPQAPDLQAWLLSVTRRSAHHACGLLSCMFFCVKLTGSKFHDGRKTDEAAQRGPC